MVKNAFANMDFVCHWGEMKLETEPIAPTTVSIQEFMKLDLRIAEIKAVRPHPNADKLIIMDVDNGTQVKQIIAGIRAYYTPESLVGKRVVLVNNLEPALLRGERSEGMLLAAEDQGRIVVLVPEQPVSPGAKVR